MDSAQEHVDQFSEQSWAQLRAASARFAEALQQHTTAPLALPGGTVARQEANAHHDRLRSVAAAWSDAVLDHTGTFPSLGRTSQEDDGDDEDEDDDWELGEPDQPLPVQVGLSLVSRWDLDVTDTAALVAAGRDAFRANQPGESEADARAAIPDDDLRTALYELAYGSGARSYRTPGVEVDRAHRVFVLRDGPGSDTAQSEITSEPEDDDVDGPPLIVPPGRVLMHEHW